jgi:hypothetical protein
MRPYPPYRDRGSPFHVKQRLLGLLHNLLDPAHARRIETPIARPKTSLVGPTRYAASAAR